MVVMLQVSQAIGDLGIMKNEVTLLNLDLHPTVLLTVLGVILVMVVLLVVGVLLDLRHSSSSISLRAWDPTVLVKLLRQVGKLLTSTVMLLFLLCVHRVLNYLASTIPILVPDFRQRSLLVMLPLSAIVICSASGF